MSDQVPPDEKEPDPASEEIVWVGETGRAAQIVFPDGGADAGGSVPAVDPQPAATSEEPDQPQPETVAATPHADAIPAATLPTPASQSKALAEAVVSSFVDRLIAEATRKGGYLTVRDLQEMNREFEKKGGSPAGGVREVVRGLCARPRARRVGPGARISLRPPDGRALRPSVP